MSDPNKIWNIFFLNPPIPLSCKVAVHIAVVAE